MGRVSDMGRVLEAQIYNVSSSFDGLTVASSHALLLTTESPSFAWQSIWTNKLRTMLSLLGVMVGIFVIGSVFAVVDSLESELRDTFNMLDEDVLFVTKWPWTSEGEEIILGGSTSSAVRPRKPTWTVRCPV